MSQIAPVKLLFVVNNLSFFVSHRLAIGIEAIEQGYDVAIACPPSEDIAAMEEKGFTVFSISVLQQSHGVRAQLRFFFSVYRICRKFRPDICHSITLKTFLVAGMASRFAGIKKRIGSISGLGYFFMSETHKAFLGRLFLRPFFKIAMSGYDAPVVIFQNEDDRKLLSGYASIKYENTRIIRGSGVNLKQFYYSPEPDGDLSVLLLSRMLKDKGVEEFVQAAQELKASGINAKFILAGLPDETNPASLTMCQLQKWHESGVLSWMGYANDAASLLRSVHIVVLPSYREGFPKVLIEASACGRAIVTTDVPGCRDAIETDKSGLLVPAQAVQPLKQAIKLLILDEDKRKKMGLAGAELAQKYYSVSNVVKRHIDIYKSL